jgi:hypothetical protein
MNASNPLPEKNQGQNSVVSMIRIRNVPGVPVPPAV